MKTISNYFKWNASRFNLGTAILLLFSLAACQKAEQPTDEDPPTGEMQIVKFTASGMYKSYKGYGSGVSEVPIQYHLHYLYYYAFDKTERK